jgi:methylaspartate mutase epsilon subunit
MTAQSVDHHEPRIPFHCGVKAASQHSGLAVQPRMGVADPCRMARALKAVCDSSPATVGTLTVDSFTRVGDLRSVAEGLANGSPLNGYPITTHGAVRTRQVLDAVNPGYPVQVRHGTPAPELIVRVMLSASLDATEGGPVSYCLPYGRTSLRDSLKSWANTCRLLASGTADGRPGHLESFGGCMMGQLCPPAMLLAINVLEGLFARHYGVTSLSFSYAQQTNYRQDVAAVRSLKRLVAEFFPENQTHLVVYTFMGLYPQTLRGCERILFDSVRIAREGQAQRLIVKTVAEHERIPSVEENIAALKQASQWSMVLGTTAGCIRDDHSTSATDSLAGEIEADARHIVEEVLDVHPDPARAIAGAFQRGLLDIPFCLHPDNKGQSMTRLDADGLVRWAERGRIPADSPSSRRTANSSLSSADYLRMLSYNQLRYDARDQQ